MFGRNLPRIGQKALVNSHPASGAFRGATWAQPRIPPGVPRSLQEKCSKGRVHTWPQSPPNAMPAKPTLYSAPQGAHLSPIRWGLPCPWPKP